ncbi:hypothetical protein [Streptomyces sp. NPDC052114]|uniref:hypothetical protein n=1 Tax=unclassified Streptomyces TaxID=2593676 RepID=UPI003437090D
MTTPFQSPERCILCQHTIRDGERVEPRMRQRNSGGPVPGVAHVDPCPIGVEPLPCALCLRAVLTDAPGPHPCQETTSLGVDGARIVVIPETHCLCRCPLEGDEAPPAESKALTDARAEARRQVGAE